LPFNASSQNSKIKAFKHYNSDQGMSSNIALYIIQDKTGYLWIGTSLYLEKLDSTTGKFAHLFPHPTGETL